MLPSVASRWYGDDVAMMHAVLPSFIHHQEQYACYTMMAIKETLRMNKSTWTILCLTILVAIVQQSTAFAPISLRSSTQSTPHIFASSSSSDTELVALRKELKGKLLASADEFKSIQSDLTNAIDYETKMEDDADNKRYYYPQLLGRILRKVMGRKPKKQKSMLE